MGDRRTLVVEGDEGVSKTALLSELGRRARAWFRSPLDTIDGFAPWSPGLTRPPRQPRVIAVLAAFNPARHAVVNG